MNELPLATDPRQSFSVLASAGTGKTWQLVARLTRLLLDGACIDSMLAITFTRKAAGEMQQRMTRQLVELLDADDKQLDSMLALIGETPGSALRERARSLLESWLRNERPLRTLTFHSFCQELLQRFPLEAGLPPGFDLLEQPGLLIEESWDALFNEATLQPDSKPAQALEELFESLGKLSSARAALIDFIEHRSDWWAWTAGSDEPVDTAIDYIETAIALNPAEDADAFWNEFTRKKLQRFAALLGRHDSVKTNRAHRDLIAELTERRVAAKPAVEQLRTVFFTKQGPRRSRKPSAILKRKMGKQGEEDFLSLHEWFCERLEAVAEQQARLNTLRVNRAWYCAGQRMLEHFQRIKRERRVLDFPDLEWNAYRLLSEPAHAHWIQYKLDQNIDHLLIDEFQDTNPTQWRLVLPLLEEMASGDSGRWRSLFIVGDAKQSIYRFRRGNPKLLGLAARWMHDRLGAGSVQLNLSWRSSRAVLDFVNELFDSKVMQGVLENFSPHGTHQSGLWGRVEVWPAFRKNDAAGNDAPAALRNPLQQAREENGDRPAYREGLAIAGRINELIEQRVQVGADDTARAIGHDDILILLRSRTHLKDYEGALRDCAIPYLSLDRGTLLQNLEIRDLESLMRVLMLPHDNLALAQVLRSPIFSASDDDLVSLARHGQGNWFERLDNDALSAPLQRAHQLLVQWHALAGQIPIHDLLERIFHEANIVNRYCSASPANSAARIKANLTRFVELALEVDSGRYPTLSRFLDHLKQLRSLEKDGPSEASLPGTRGRVRLMTVHGAKGLEAPVVFVADACNTANAGKGAQALVCWPAESDRPSHFLLTASTRGRDSVSAALHADEQSGEQREAANLLYVALTRARHMLIISATRPDGKALPGWYGNIVDALFDGEEPADSAVFGQHQLPRYQGDDTKEETPASRACDPRLSRPITTEALQVEIAPSRDQEDIQAASGNETGRYRGLAIHRFLQLYCEKAGGNIIERVAGELQWNAADSRLQDWLAEAESVLASTDLAWLFRPDRQTWNEVPIQYRRNGKTVFGIVDRLVRDADGVHVIDYKTHRVETDTETGVLIERYKPQLENYREGARRLWPGEAVHCYLLFTARAQLVEIP